MALEFLDPSPAEVAESAAVQNETAAPETPITQPAIAEEAAPVAEPVKVADPAKPVDDRPKFVPHAALHEERVKRQALERELADLRAGKAPAEPAQPIDPETDPIAALKEIREWQSKQVAQSDQQRQVQEFSQRVQTHEADYAASDPEYGDKVAYLRDWRAGQIKANAAALGHVVSDQQIGQMLMGEALKLSYDAMQTGKNPGEVFAALAAANGYKPKAAPVPETPVEAQPDPVELEKSVAVVDRITRGLRAARPTANAGGNEPAGDTTLADLASLDGAAFDKAFTKFSKSQARH